MRLVVTTLVALVLVAGLAIGGCGVKNTNEGNLKSFDSSTKTIVVAGGGADAKLTVTPKTEVKDASGNTAELSSLVGKKVKVISEHKKVDSVTAAD